MPSNYYDVLGVSRKADEKEIRQAYRKLEAKKAKQQAVDVADIRRAMGNITEVYYCLQPYERRELMQLIIAGAEINEREMVLEIRTGACMGATDVKRGEVGAKGGLRFEPPDWLPGQDSNLRPSG